jgi:hypothetical protein
MLAIRLDKKPHRCPLDGFASLAKQQVNDDGNHHRARARNGQSRGDKRHLATPGETVNRRNVETSKSAMAAPPTPSFLRFDVLTF